MRARVARSTRAPLHHTLAHMCLAYGSRGARHLHQMRERGHTLPQALHGGARQIERLLVKDFKRARSRLQGGGRVLRQPGAAVPTLSFRRDSRVRGGRSRADAQSACDAAVDHARFGGLWRDGAQCRQTALSALFAPQKTHQTRRLNTNIKSGFLPKFQLTIRLRVHV